VARLIPALAPAGSGRDTPAMFFTPSWKKEAKLLAKGARKFVHYKRDLLKPDRVAEIESRRDDLLAAVKDGDRAKVDEASKQLRATCENSLRSAKPPTWLEENVEVMFVAVVIALGLRAYFLQPFRIPTGSMQPTLNGIIGTRVAEKDWPAFPQRVAEMALRGRQYVKVVNDRDRYVKIGRIPTTGEFVTDLRDTQYWKYFSRSKLHFADGQSLWMPAPSSQIYQLGLSAALEKAAQNGGRIPAGTVLCEGTIDAGDLVLVDRVSYHFRRPERGEVFVFDTRGIEGTRQAGGDQSDSTHYIKRLCGLPGDTLSIAPPNLLVDGKVAGEPGIAHVYDLPLSRRSSSADAETGYAFANPAGSKRGALLVKPGDTLSLRGEAPYGLREYAALGDNSGNSLDSRYWGSVKEFNLVGPALFSLWPVTTGHWGFIR
jgi:signal peptidase I